MLTVLFQVFSCILPRAFLKKKGVEIKNGSVQTYLKTKSLDSILFT